MASQRIVPRIKCLSGSVFPSDSRGGPSSSFVGRVSVPDANMLQNVSCLIDRGLRVAGVGSGGCCCERGSSQTRTVCRVDRAGVAFEGVGVETLAQLGGVAQVDEARDSFVVVHCTEAVGLVG